MLHFVHWTPYRFKYELVTHYLCVRLFLWSDISPVSVCSLFSCQYIVNEYKNIYDVVLIGKL